MNKLVSILLCHAAWRPDKTRYRLISGTNFRSAYPV
jgi:hypothetical protein